MLPDPDLPETTLAKKLTYLLVQEEISRSRAMVMAISICGIYPTRTMFDAKGGVCVDRNHVQGEL